jgi:hypothetical protein
MSCPKMLVKENMLSSMIAVAFQNIFYIKIYQNDIFYFFKIIFKISILKHDSKH